jgi:hypothetical protein
MGAWKDIWSLGEGHNCAVVTAEERWLEDSDILPIFEICKLINYLGYGNVPFKNKWKTKEGLKSEGEERFNRSFNTFVIGDKKAGLSYGNLSMYEYAHNIRELNYEFVHNMRVLSIEDSLCCSLLLLLDGLGGHLAYSWGKRDFERLGRFNKDTADEIINKFFKRRISYKDEEYQGAKRYDKPIEDYPGKGVINIGGVYYTKRYYFNGRKRRGEGFKSSFVLRLSALEGDERLYDSGYGGVSSLLSDYRSWVNEIKSGL